MLYKNWYGWSSQWLIGTTDKTFALSVNFIGMPISPGPAWLGKESLTHAFFNGRNNIYVCKIFFHLVYLGALDKPLGLQYHFCIESYASLYFPHSTSVQIGHYLPNHKKIQLSTWWKLATAYIKVGFRIEKLATKEACVLKIWSTLIRNYSIQKKSHYFATQVLKCLCKFCFYIGVNTVVFVGYKSFKHPPRLSRIELKHPCMHCISAQIF